MKDILKQHWFFIGILMIFFAIVSGSPKVFAELGQFLKINHGPDFVIVAIFLLSGLTLDSEKVSTGIKEYKSIITALGVIFLAAPFIAACFSFLPVGIEIVTGLFIVSVMPTTISSGVVMTGKAGGNIANALLITIISSVVAVFTIPFSLSFLLKFTGDNSRVLVDERQIIIKIAFFVILPLIIGMVVRLYSARFFREHEKRLMSLNQFFVLVIIWMAVSQAQTILIENSGRLLLIGILVLAYHFLLSGSAFLMILILKLKPGKRESVIFMGGQKTLPLAVIVQISFFPQYPVALVVCVLHHAVQLLVDSYLSGRMMADIKK